MSESLPGYDAYKLASPPDTTDTDDAWAEHVRSLAPRVAEAMVTWWESNAQAPGEAAWEARRSQWYRTHSELDRNCRLSDFPEPRPVYHAPEGPRRALVAANLVFLESLSDANLEVVACAVDVLTVDREQWERDWAERKAEEAWDER